MMTVQITDSITNKALKTLGSLSHEELKLLVFESTAWCISYHEDEKDELLSLDHKEFLECMKSDLLDAVEIYEMDPEAKIVLLTLGVLGIEF